MKKSLLILLSLFLTSCTAIKEKNPENEPPTEDETFETYTATIALSGGTFASFAKEAGKQIDDLNHTSEKEELVLYISSKLEYDSTLENLSCTNLNTTEWETGAALCVGTGYFGKGKFKSGSLTWTSAFSIYSVEIKARAYTKMDDYAGIEIIDEPAKLKIDQEDPVSLVDEGATEVSIITISKSYEEGTDSFTITSIDARVLLQEITITWRK